MTDKQTEFPLIDSTPPVGGVEWKQISARTRQKKEEAEHKEQLCTMQNITTSVSAKCQWDTIWKYLLILINVQYTGINVLVCYVPQQFANPWTPSHASEQEKLPPHGWIPRWPEGFLIHPYRVHQSSWFRIQRSPFTEGAWPNLQNGNPCRDTGEMTTNTPSSL